jgi:hypothetical protein
MIYLASPYTDPDPEVMRERYRACCTVLAYFAQSRPDYVLYSPIAMWHPIAELHNLPREVGFWWRQDEHMIKNCAMLLVLMYPGYDTSKGVDREEKLAGYLGIPVRYLTWTELDIVDFPPL